jgi:putative transcriptional regulator
MERRPPFALKPARLPWIALAAALMVSAALAGRWRPLIPVQTSARAKDLAAGKILVARRSLLDPKFAETVVLLVEHGEKGTVGLILNRQTKIPLSRLSKELDGVKGRTDPLYLGGPVEIENILALLRSHTRPEDAKQVAADIYIISSKTMLEKTMASAADSKTLRLYLGYAGWGTGQLAFELRLDSWDILPATAGIVFDPHPETLWTRLIEQEELQMAGLRGTTPELYRP